MHDFNAAFAYVDAITNHQAETTTIDFRAIHDTRKDIPAIPFRGTLAECWQSITYYNSQGYGIFANINAMDGNGHTLANVAHIRVQCIDLDNLSAQQNYERATAWQPSPSFAVQSSPGKFHVYWCIQPYQGNDYNTLIQRKLRQFFDGDRTIIDPSRVMRLPGTLHLKNPETPHLVQCWALAGYGNVYPVTVLETALAGVNVIAASGGRHELGDETLTAPSLEWVQYALSQIDPNKLDRGEWISITSAYKQSVWNHTTEENAFNIWSEWCAQYETNDQGENLKQWNSIRETEIGWPSIVRRVPSIIAYQKFKGVERQPTSLGAAAAMPMPEQTNDNLPPMGDCSGEFLTDAEQRIWFEDCYYVERFGEILTPSGRLMNATKFNGAFGGKKFIIDSNGKAVNEAWQAATRSTLWTVPKVDHLRFVPQSEPYAIINDELGRKGVNTYKPAIISSKQGDVTPFLNHMQLMLPVQSDREILLGYLAHNVKFPGYKIPWAPLVQSVEGVGKGVLKRVIRHCIGGPYVHFPNAQELIESGSKFNAWMRGKLFILVDEVKVDERRDMIEVLKPMISEAEIEIQGKGHDQDKEDNYSNWAFFSNYKDAIPVNKNGRRFSIFYSAIQSVDDLRIRNMGDDYFNRLYGWLDNSGAEYVADYLLNYPIERGTVPMRAPDTSSTAEAVRQSRGPIETAILDAVEDQLTGFRGGWISTLAVMARLRALGIRQPAQKTIATILETLGYFYIGRSPRPYFQESATDRSGLYNVLRDADVNQYGRWQGYE